MEEEPPEAVAWVVDMAEVEAGEKAAVNEAALSAARLGQQVGSPSLHLVAVGAARDMEMRAVGTAGRTAVAVEAWPRWAKEHVRKVVIMVAVTQAYRVLKVAAFEVMVRVEEEEEVEAAVRTVAVQVLQGLTATTWKAARPVVIATEEEIATEIATEEESSDLVVEAEAAKASTRAGKEAVAMAAVMAAVMATVMAAVMAAAGTVAARATVRAAVRAAEMAVVTAVGMAAVTAVGMAAVTAVGMAGERENKRAADSMEPAVAAAVVAVDSEKVMAVMAVVTMGALMEAKVC